MATFAGLTVNALLKECERMVKNGDGNKVVLISNDEEGNGFHTLFYGFNETEDDINYYIENGLIYENVDSDKIVLLG